MKRTAKLAILIVALGLMVCQVEFSEGVPMGKAWTYQGRLIDTNKAADGLYDFQFKLYNDANVIDGNQVGSDVNVPDVDVIDGYFTVELDFGGSVFNGDARWLEVGVRPGDSNDPNAFATLSPRQEITPTPYSLQTRGIFVDNKNNVGIGTTSPAEKLHVVGDIRLDAGGDIAFADDNTRIHQSSGDLYLEADDDIYIWPDDDIRVDGATLFVDGSENRVGIGTTSPGAPLEIKHSDWPDIVKVGMSGTSNRLILSSGASWASISGGTTNQDHIVIRHSTGNIGIGTTDPQAKLSVGGEGTEGWGYGIYSESLGGVCGKGLDYGVVGYCDDDYGTNIGVLAHAGSDGSNEAIAVQAEVYRSGGGTYYSGYFFDVGSGGQYNGLYADYRTGGAIDLAEYILDTFADTEPGDVLVADPHNNESVIKSSKAYDSSVIGVVSTEPHMTIGMELIMDEDTGEMYENVNAAQLTLAGRIPVKVTDENGLIRRGDLLTTSCKPGHAMKWSLLDVNEAKDFEELKSILAENEKRRNAILGKALGPHQVGDGTIIALLSLQ